VIFAHVISAIPRLTNADPTITRFRLVFVLDCQSQRSRLPANASIWNPPLFHIQDFLPRNVAQDAIQIFNCSAEKFQEFRINAPPKFANEPICWSIGAKSIT
jgi:hypothetical protein